ncbi:MAG TPA: PEGA domain-containing protein [Polyangiaceae bacterium]|nr:PEGA domain-containing protein [Polyangiaceae bacterium]
MKLFSAAALLLAAACGGANAAPRTVSLRMAGTPADARVTVDDQIVGTLDVVAARGVALPPGKHRVSVEAPGYFPYDTVVEAKEGEKFVKIEAKLVPVPD